MVMSKTVPPKKKKSKPEAGISGIRQMAAGEFKAKCLAIMDEVKETGRPLIVTKRGEPTIKVVPINDHKRKPKDDFFGRLKGVIEIVGDPDDLIKPVFPLEDYDMLK
jgi:prevent-host-death family protein